MNKKCCILRIILVFLFIITAYSCDNRADTIILNGKILTVDKDFTIAEALAISGEEIIAVGSNSRIRKMAGSKTTIVDAAGKTVIPGIIDAHAHPEDAALSELVETIPDVHTVEELVDWIKSQTLVKQPGEWIIHPKIFFTRLLDFRQPRLSILDSVAPSHPVFLNGSYGGMINTAAMRLSGLNKETVHEGVLKDKETGDLTGFIRSSAFNLLHLSPKRNFSRQERIQAIQDMFTRYNQYGMTTICAAAGDYELFEMYRDLGNEGKLSMRVYINILLRSKPGTSVEMLIDNLKSFDFVTGDGTDWARIGAVKLFLDGGILTGTAFLREPWGQSAYEVFGISDTAYRGVINYTHEQLLSFVKVANEHDWKFTAHCTGGGGVDLLLDVFDEVNEIKSIKPNRFSIIHGNFYTPASIQRMKELGVYADMQPAWFYKDADAMKHILGERRIEYFHPYRSLIDGGVIVNGGSDHMVKWDPNVSVNPYNPFLAMWSIVTRTTERNSVVVPMEAVTREEALRMYTINNAYASFEESRKGSLEAGKLADLAILSGDYLDCPAQEIREIKSELTMVGGRIVYSSGNVHADIIR
jgi:predicted amidohydrolase YtcJ